MLTIQTIIAEVRKLAEEKPDFIYKRPGGLGTTCKYTEGKNCDGCIFGQAIFRLSPEHRQFLLNADNSSDGTLETLFEKMSVEHSEQQVRWCSRVQMNQDDGYAWSEAIKNADENFPLT